MSKPSEHPQGQWVKVIGGWSPYQFEERRFPTMDELRKAVPDRPFIVQYAYNRAFMNQQAMDAFGVGTDRFPQLPGTEFEKDEQGRTTGRGAGLHLHLHRHGDHGAPALFR